MPSINGSVDSTDDDSSQPLSVLRQLRTAEPIVRRSTIPRLSKKEMDYEEDASSDYEIVSNVGG